MDPADWILPRGQEGQTRLPEIRIWLHIPPPFPKQRILLNPPLNPIKLPSTGFTINIVKKIAVAVHVFHCNKSCRLAIRLDPETENRLEQLARKTGRTKTYYTREAILEHLVDMEDYYLAVEALQNPGQLYTEDEAKRELGL